MKNFHQPQPSLISKQQSTVYMYKTSLQSGLALKITAVWYVVINTYFTRSEIPHAHLHKRSPSAELSASSTRAAGQRGGKLHLVI